MRDAVIELIEECEADNGSIGGTDLFDQRLIETRKWFNDGKDPFEHKFYDFDFRSAQLMLNQGISKQRIADELGVTRTGVNDLISMESLNSTKWAEIQLEQSDSASLYTLSRGKKKLATGTIKELAKFMKVPVGTIRYWKSTRYKAKQHKVTYRVTQKN